MTEARKSNRGPSAAAENRAALVAAAREELAAGGFDVPLSAIARRAGVGQGSLYRHFPDRVSLALAVFADNVDRLAELSAAPDATLESLLGAIGDQAVASSAFVQMLSTARHDARVIELGDRVAKLLTHHLVAAQAEGRAAGWLTPDDLMVAVGMFGAVVGEEDSDRRMDTARRARRLLLSAVRP